LVGRELLEGTTSFNCKPPIWKTEDLRGGPPEQVRHWMGLVPVLDFAGEVDARLVKT